MSATTHHEFSLLGIGGAAISSVFAVAAEQPLWVPISCALIAASVPLSNNAIRWWQALCADRRAGYVARLAAQQAEIDRLKALLDLARGNE